MPKERSIEERFLDIVKKILSNEPTEVEDTDSAIDALYRITLAGFVATPSYIETGILDTEAIEIFNVYVLRGIIYTYLYPEVAHAIIEHLYDDSTLIFMKRMMELHLRIKVMKTRNDAAEIEGDTDLPQVFKDLLGELNNGKE